MDLVWLVHGFSTHRLIAGLGIPPLVVWQRRLTTCSLMNAGGSSRTAGPTRRAKFLNNDHRLVVATLKLQLKSGRMVPSQPKLDVGKLKDERVAEEFANRLSGNFGQSECFGDS